MYGRDAMATHPRETERLINSPQKKHGPVELGGAGAAVEHRHDRPSRCRRRATFFGPTGKQARLMCVAIGIVIIISAASFAWMIKRSLDEELLPTTTLPQKQSSVLEATVIQPPQHEAAVVGTVIDSEGEEVNTETTTEGKESGVPPNVIFILLDDMGMNDFGFRSTDLMEMTPYIDGLAEKGVRLDNYYTNHICTPARASLMTGRDSFLTGMQFQELSGPEPWGLPLDEATLGNRFQAAGYATHMVGKWNLGMFSEAYYPFNRGFETYLGFLGARETYFTHKLGVYKDYGYGDADGYVDDTTNTTRWGPELEGYYSTNITAERAIQVVEEHMAERETTGVETPLFLYLAFQAAHGPLETPPKDMFTDEQWEVLNTINREDELRQKFAKIVYFLDITLRLMFERFDQVGMLEDTLVVIASDNGGCPSSGGNNMPFRGFKWTLFEGGVRAPAIVWSKSDSIVPKEARGTIYTGMMHAIDWTPTLANLTGIPTEGMGKPLSGLDHWEAIIGKRPTSDPPVRNELVLGRSAYEYDSDSDSMKLLQAPRGAYIYDGWKIVHGDRAAGWFSFTPDDEVPECTVCTSIACEYYPYLNRTFLFHLEEDPLEIVDLGHAMPDKVEEMLDRWNIACQDEVVPNYKARDGNAFDTWKAFNDWIVAWK